MSQIRKRNGGFELVAGRRQSHFIRAESEEAAIAIYCSRTGADPSEFVKPDQPVAAPLKKEPETVAEVVAEFEEEGGEIPTFPTELAGDGGIE